MLTCRMWVQTCETSVFICGRCKGANTNNKYGCIKKKKHTSHQSYLLGVKVLSERLKTVHEMLNGTCRMWVQACKTSVFIVPNGKLHQVKYVQFQKKKKNTKAKCSR